MTQEISKIIKESRSKLARFEKTLEGFGIHGSPEDCAVALARKQQQEKEQTDALEARIEAQERESAAFKYETMNVIGEIHSRLSKLCLCSMPAPQKLAEQRQEIRRYLEQLEGERKTLDSFVQELAVVLQLPPAPDLETGMAAIRQALVPPPKSDVFNTEPELGRLKPTTKDLLCRFCLSLIPDSPIENFQSKDTEYLVDLVSTKLTDCRQIEEFARAAVRGSDVSVERGVVSDSVYEFVQELRKGTDTQLASLREEIGQLKHSVSNKDAEISVLSSRMKQCQEQFLEYVKLAQGESDARSRRLQDIAAFFNSKD
jgi:chromosome segregation ATPase